jgi:hypothetical protein
VRAAIESRINDASDIVREHTRWAHEQHSVLSG